MNNLYARSVFFVSDVTEKGIQTERLDWGRPLLVIRDLDANEIFFWMPNDDWARSETPTLESSGINEHG